MKLLLTFFLLATLPTFSSAADFIEFPLPGPMAAAYSGERVQISYAQAGTVVGGSENPFGAESASAIHVTNDMTGEESQFRFRARLAEGDAPLKGELELKFLLREGAIQLHLGENPELYEQRRAETLQINGPQVYCLLTLSVGESPHLSFAGRSLPVTAEGSEIIEAETTYIVKVAWDFTEGNPSFNLSINGQPLRRVDGGESFWSATEATSKWRGINVLGIFSRHHTKSDYFIGPISHQASE